MITAPEIYPKYITVNKIGETVIYVEALNDIYGIIKLALLFQKNSVGYITFIVFKLNPYAPCVTNHIINVN